MLVFLPQPFWIDWRLHFPFFLVSYFYYMTYYQWSMECILPEGVCWHSCRHIGHVQKESLCWLKEDWGALYSSLLKGRGKPFPSPCVVVVFLLDPIFIPPASDGLYSLTVVDFALNVKSAIWLGDVDKFTKYYRLHVDEVKYFVFSKRIQAHKYIE